MGRRNGSEKIEVWECGSVWVETWGWRENAGRQDIDEEASNEGAAVAELLHHR
jgi:hypothetical protein